MSRQDENDYNKHQLSLIDPRDFIVRQTELDDHL